MIKAASYALMTLIVCGCVAVDKPSNKNQSVKSENQNSKSQLEFYQGAWDESVELAAGARTSTQAVKLAAKAMADGDENKAAAFYARAFELDKKNVDAGYQLAVLHRKAGNNGQAEQLYRFLLKQSPRHIASLEGLGLLLLAQDNIKESRRLLVKAFAVYQNKMGTEKSLQNYIPIKALNGLGLLADRESDYRQAQAYYQQGLKLDPSSVVLMNNLAYSFYLFGDWKQAEKLLNEVLSIKPQYTRAIYNLALVNVRARRFSRAIKLLGKIMEPYEASNDVGYLAMMAGDNAQAEQLFQQAIDQAPSYHESAWRNMDKLKQLKVAP